MSTFWPEVDKLSEELLGPEERAVALASAHAQLVEAAGSEDGTAALQEDAARRSNQQVFPL
jgi:hypothetical protein